MNRTSFMPQRSVISGVCAELVCRYCFTKYGWIHQMWCEYSFLSELSCADCRYYNARTDRCEHPARKNRTEGYGE